MIEFGVRSPTGRIDDSLVDLIGGKVGGLMFLEEVFERGTIGPGVEGTVAVFEEFDFLFRLHQAAHGDAGWRRASKARAFRLVRGHTCTEDSQGDTDF